MRFRAIQKLLAVLLLFIFIISTVLVYLANQSFFVAIFWSFMTILGAVFPPNGILIDPNNPLILVAEMIDIPGRLITTVILTTVFYQFLSKVNLREKITERAIARLSRHVIISPANGMGIETANILHRENIPLVVIEPKPADARRMIDRGIFAISGDPAHLESLKRAGLQKAWYLILLDENDVNNTLIALEAKKLNCRIKIISRIKREEDIARMKMAGITRLIMPEVAQGDEIASFLYEGLKANV